MAPELHHPTEIIESPVSWNPLYRTASMAALAVVLLIPVQLFIFIAWPPPETAEGFFDLFGKNAFLGLLSLDLIYLLNNAILILFYLGLYLSLRKTNPSAMLIALILGLVGIAVYYSSSIAFEMLSLGNQYQVAETPEIRQQLLASGQTLSLNLQGEAQISNSYGFVALKSAELYIAKNSGIPNNGSSVSTCADDCESIGKVKCCNEYRNKSECERSCNNKPSRSNNNDPSGESMEDCIQNCITKCVKWTCCDKVKTS